MARTFESKPAHNCTIDLTALPLRDYAWTMAVIRSIMRRAIPADYVTVTLQSGRQFGWAPRMIHLEELHANL